MKSRAYPWRYGNQFRLLNEGEQFFAHMLSAIEGAQRYVLLEMYLIQSGAVATRFIEALTQACGRGVRACVLLDGFGALGLRRADRRRLIAGGVELRFYNALGWRKRFQNFQRNHRKLLLVDGRVAFTGGAGLTDDFAGEGARRPAWRDVIIESRGPVVTDWEELFAQAWRTSGGEWRVQAAIPGSPFSDDAAGRVMASEGWHRAGLADSVVDRIRTAQRRVWVASPYFVPSRRFRKALRRAVRRGADVRLLVSGPLTDHPAVRHAARRFFGKLLYNRVRIFEYQPRVLHAKIVLCDGWASIGSSNLDRWSFKWNLEANQEVEHRSFANRVAARFEEDFAESLELDRRLWPQRGWFNRLREHGAGVLDRLLERWRRNGSF